MESLDSLAVALYVEEVRRARRTPPEEKFLEGPRLFERACRVMMDGIRHDHPEFDEEQMERELPARIAIVGSLDTA
jgi:hypothetical protein